MSPPKLLTLSFEEVGLIEQKEDQLGGFALKFHTIWEQEAFFLEQQFTQNEVK